MTYHYFSGCGRVDFFIPDWVVESCNHPGPCDSDVKEALDDPDFRAELDKIEPEALSEMLSECTDWDVSDHETNLMRLVWIAAGDVQDEPESYTDC